MIAKLVAHATSRAEAIDRLTATLEAAQVWPVRTNAGFLFSALSDQDFGAARIDTGFIERKLDSLLGTADDDEAVLRGAALVALAREDDELAGFRLNAAPRHSVALGSGGTFRTVDLATGVAAAPVSGFRDEERVVVFHHGQAHEFALSTRGKVGAAAGDGSLVAPMPGKVTSVEVEAGEQVVKGQRLLTLEAMKMEHAMLAPFDGVLAELNVAAGAQVQVDAVLARVEVAT